MSENPDAFTDEDGKWIRRDVLVAEMREDEGVEPEKCNALIDEMIADGDFNVQSLGDDEYVQLSSLTTGIKILAKYYSTKPARRARDIFNRTRDQ